jgi:hypothetical protein
MACPAPVPVLPLGEDQTRFELLDATTPKDLEGSNFLAESAGQDPQADIVQLTGRI